MYKRRHIEGTVLKLTKSFPVIILTGPRQTGKTTLLEHLRGISRHSYVSLDEFEIRSLAKNDPGLFIERYQPPLIIDEIQYAPQLLPYIKSLVDKRAGKCSFWLTGSQHFNLMKGVSESLAGRAAILKLLGFSYAEGEKIPAPKRPWFFQQAKIIREYPEIKIKALFERILKGSYPKLFSKNKPPLETFYGSYVQTYIDRDLRDVVKVGSLSSFEKFIRLCAARTAQLLNFSDLARDSGISVNTAKEWISILEASGHIYLLRPYYRNISKRLIKAPKLFFMDTGLACYLTGWSSAETALRGAMAGSLFETFIFSEILKSYWNHGQEAPLWTYRTKEQEEIDILIEKNGKLYPVEIKLSSKITDSDLRGIRSIEKTHFPMGDSVFITASSESYPLGKSITAVPYSVIESF